MDGKELWLQKLDDSNLAIGFSVIQAPAGPNGRSRRRGVPDSIGIPTPCLALSQALGAWSTASAETVMSVTPWPDGKASGCCSGFLGAICFHMDEAASRTSGRMTGMDVAMMTTADSAPPQMTSWAPLSGKIQ